MLTISKMYIDLPFAHRQLYHKGHCFKNHGHNWSVEVTFAANAMDENGFILDFGELGFIKDYLKTYDHATVISKDDADFIAMTNAYPQFFQLIKLDDVSCEGLAKQFFDDINKLVLTHTEGRAWVSKVVVFEDSKNSATYQQ